MALDVPDFKMQTGKPDRLRMEALGLVFPAHAGDALIDDDGRAATGACCRHA